MAMEDNKQRQQKQTKKIITSSNSAQTQTKKIITSSNSAQTQKQTKKIITSGNQQRQRQQQQINKKIDQLDKLWIKFDGDKAKKILYNLADKNLTQEHQTRINEILERKTEKNARLPTMITPLAFGDKYQNMNAVRQLKKKQEQQQQMKKYTYLNENVDLMNLYRNKNLKQKQKQKKQ